MARQSGERIAGLVLDCLQKAGRPLKAYEMLATLRPHGVNAAMTIYRALDRLQAVGMVHRVESLNAFIAVPFVSGVAERAEKTLGVAICDRCGAVEPFWDTGLTRAMVHEVNDFDVRSLSLELHGFCEDCRPAAEPPKPDLRQQRKK